MKESRLTNKALRGAFNDLKLWSAAQGTYHVGPTIIWFPRSVFRASLVCILSYNSLNQSSLRVNLSFTRGANAACFLEKPAETPRPRRNPRRLWRRRKKKKSIYAHTYVCYKHTYMHAFMHTCMRASFLFGTDLAGRPNSRNWQPGPLLVLLYVAASWCRREGLRHLDP